MGFVTHSIFHMSGARFFFPAEAIPSLPAQPTPADLGASPEDMAPNQATRKQDTQ